MESESSPRVIQALFFQAERYTQEEAIQWATEHEFTVQAVRAREEEGEVTHHIIAQFEPSEAVEGSWRVMSNEFPDGITASTCERQDMSNKAYSTLEIKSYDEEARIITGIASTPTPDRDGDEVMPKGASFNLPFPLLAQHDHSLPVGQVLNAEVKDSGIEITAQIAKESGLDYVEKVWRQVKSGLLRGLSIGFRPTKSIPLKTGAKRVLAYDLFELSLVTIPANAEAGISTVKHYANEPADLDEQLFDTEARASDVLDRAAAAIAKATKSTETKGK
jgi:HK97 family phage prohead protease